MSIGETLRAARQRQNLSLRALGDLTGFSASFLSQVERGETSPSLGSLQRISEAIGLTIAGVLGQDVRARTEQGAILRRSGRGTLRSQWSKATVESLVPTSADEKLQAVLIRLEEGGRTGDTVYAPGRRLFAYCMSGAVLLVLSGPSEEFPLEAGDSVIVDGPRTLAWTNRDACPSEILAVAARV